MCEQDVTTCIGCGRTENTGHAAGCFVAVLNGEEVSAEPEGLTT